MGESIAQEPSFFDSLAQLSHRFFGGPVLETNVDSETTSKFVVDREAEAPAALPVAIATPVPTLPVAAPSGPPQLAPREAEARIFLKRHPETRRLGLHFENTPSGTVVIVGVDKGYSAEGKVFVGDRLIGVNGTRLDKNGQFQAVELIAACQDELVGLILSDDSRTVTIAREASKQKIGIDMEACNYPRPVRIVNVVEGSYAERAGLVVNDMIVSINGSRTCDRDQAHRIIATTPQATLTLKVRYVAPENIPGTAAAASSPGIVTKLVRSLSFSKRSSNPRKEERRARQDGAGTDRSNSSIEGSMGDKSPGAGATPSNEAGQPTGGIEVSQVM